MDGVQLPRSSKIRTLHGEIEALFATGFGYDKPYERISRESLVGAVCRQAARRHRCGAGQQIPVEPLSHSRGARTSARAIGRSIAFARHRVDDGRVARVGSALRNR